MKWQRNGRAGQRVVIAITALLVGISTVHAQGPAPPLRVTAIAPGYPGRAADDARWLIFLDGPIDPGATSRLVGLVLQEHIGEATVYLNSPGGSLITAMQLGRVLREHGFDAVVGAATDAVDRVGPGTCHSACPFLLAGGRHRHAVQGSSIGVHRAHNRTPLADEAAFQQRVATETDAYLDGMGVDRQLAAIMASTGPDQIRELGTNEAIRLRLIETAEP